MASIATLSTPASNANGMKSWKKCPSYMGRSVWGSKVKGTPRMMLPMATPNTSEATTPEKHSTPSQLLRQRVPSILLRYLNPTGRRINATRTSIIAR
ncbi:hypothetical protein D3C85_745810 [compost metagenome]